jgi:hypothetical protein
MRRIAVSVALALFGGLAASSEAFAQRNNSALRTQRSLYNRPTVSPYLNLLQPQGGGLPNYQTLVRPALEQRNQNLQMQRQISQLQSSVIENNVRDQRGEAMFRPTGHSTGFFYYSHFYPGMQSGGPRRR